jgi:hypothetical protein
MVISTLPAVLGGRRLHIDLVAKKNRRSVAH